MSAGTGRLGSKVHWADVLVVVGLAAAAAFYLWRLDAWLINDDEGSYLYAAWRISLGELPYRDFLTPQLPTLLLPGGLLMRLVEPGVLAARALVVACTLGAGALVWATARRLFGPPTALLAGAAFLLHPDVYLFTRVYRAEPFMLLFVALGLALFARGAFPRPGAGEPPERRWLVLAGAAFGAATLAKLFGLLPLAGCLAWLVTDGAWRRRPAAAIARDGLAVLTAAGVVVAAVLGAFAVASGSAAVYEAVLGHHLMQGAALGPADVLAKGLRFFLEYVRHLALPVFVALAAAAMAWRRRDRAALLMAWQLPTALAFLLLSRELFPRHLLYLVPALAILFALAVRDLAAPAGRHGGRGAMGGDIARPLAAALVLALVVPWGLLDRDYAWRWETGTRRLADFVQLTTGPEDLVFSDYSELNFYARRPTTYAAASLSAGAAGSGQISWARLAGELDGRTPPLLLLDASEQYGHLRFLVDRPDFEAWVAEGYGPPVGVFRRDHQEYEVHAPKDRPLPVLARFAGGPTLVAAGPTRGEVGSGEALVVRAAWHAPEPPGAELAVAARLVDDAGRVWAAGDGALEASAAELESRHRVRPATRWQAGEITSDRVELTVPRGTPPGEYELRLGLYRRDEVDLLEAEAVNGTALGRTVPVGRVRVRPWRAGPGAVAALGLDRVAAAELDTGLRFLGRVALPAEPVPAGTVLPLELWWHVAGAAPPGRTVRITLGDPAIGALAADVTLPLGPGGWPPETWPTEGIVWRQPVRVPISAAAAGGPYTLQARVVDDSPADPDAVTPLELGTVTVTPRDLADLVTMPPPVEWPRAATLGDVAELIGADAPTHVAPGDPLTVRLVWRALGASTEPLAVTLQLLDDAGRPAAQHDGGPAGGARPTTGWLAGEFVVDEHIIRVPADLSPGTYRAIAALYDPASLARLPVTGPDGRGDAVAVVEVEVGR